MKLLQSIGLVGLWVLVTTGALTAEETPPLPGPGLDVPVDLDGDGVSGFADRYLFNYWLEQGGSLTTAMSYARVSEGVIDLSAFFSSPEAALSADAAILSAGSSGGAEAEGSPCPCGPTGTGAQMTATFGGGGPGVQTGCVFCDDAKLRFADGHAIDSGAQVYVARWVNNTNGGVTKIDLSIAKTIGALPIDDAQVTILSSGMLLATQVVWEASSNDLLVTLERLSPNGMVKRLDLDVQPPTVIDEVPAGSLDRPDGIVIIPSDHCNFGNEGELLIAQDLDGASGGAIRKYGVNSATACPQGTKVVFTPGGLSGFNFPQGMAIGDFNGAGTFGIYFAETSSGRVVRGVATNPQSFTTSVFAVGMTSPDNVVFDPYSESLFVSEDRSTGRIWRLKPDGAMALFATNMTRPQGMSFLPGGTMLVSEQDSHRVIVLDGWRNMFNRGDANADGSINLSDGPFILNWLFHSGPDPPCLDAADADDSSEINLTDAQYILRYLFQGGPPPPPPFFGTNAWNGFCTDPSIPLSDKIDPTIDLLGCRQYLAGCDVTW